MEALACENLFLKNQLLKYRQNAPIHNSHSHSMQEEKSTPLVSTNTINNNSFVTENKLEPPFSIVDQKAS